MVLDPPAFLDADPNPSSTNKTLILDAIAQAVDVQGSSFIPPTLLTYFPLGCTLTLCNLILMTLRTVRQANMRNNSHAFSWRLPTISQIKQMLPPAASAEVVAFAPDSPNNETHSFMNIGKSKLMLWMPTPQQLRELLHPCLRMSHAKNLTNWWRTRNIFPCPEGAALTIYGAVMQARTVEPPQDHASTRTQELHRFAHTARNSARAQKTIDQLSTELSKYTTLEFAALPFPPQQFVQPVIYNCTIAHDPAHADAPNPMPVLENLGELYASDDESTEEYIEEMESLDSASDVDSGDGDSGVETEALDLAPSAPPLPMDYSQLMADAPPPPPPHGVAWSPPPFATHVGSHEVPPIPPFETLTGCTTCPFPAPPASHMDLDEESLPELVPVDWHRRHAPTFRIPPPGVLWTPYEVNLTAPHLDGDYMTPSEAISAMCDATPALRDAFGSETEDESDNPPLTYGQLVGQHDMPLLWSSALECPEQISRWASLRSGPLMGCPVLDSTVTIELLPLFDIRAPCGEIGHHVNRQGQLVHDACVSDDPELAGDWAALRKDRLGNPAVLMPLTQALTAERPSVRRVLGTVTRFPVMARGALLHWVPPPGNVEALLFEDDRTFLPRECFDTAYFDPVVVYQDGRCSVSPAAYLNALGIPLRQAASMLPITPSGLGSLFAEITAKAIYPPSHFVDAVMKARNIPGPGLEKFGSLDFFGLQQTITVEDGDDRASFLADLEAHGPKVGAPFYDAYHEPFDLPSMVSHGSPAPAGRFEDAYPEVWSSFDDNFREQITFLAETFEELDKELASITLGGGLDPHNVGIWTDCDRSGPPVIAAAGREVSGKLAKLERSARMGIKEVLQYSGSPMMRGHHELKAFCGRLESRLFSGFCRRLDLEDACRKACMEEVD